MFENCCWLQVVCCACLVGCVLPIAMRCLMRDVWCLLIVVGCGLFDVWCLLFDVFGCYLFLFVVCCVLNNMFGLLFVSWVLRVVVCWLLASGC